MLLNTLCSYILKCGLLAVFLGAENCGYVRTTLSMLDDGSFKGLAWLFQTFAHCDIFNIF